MFNPTKVVYYQEENGGNPVSDFLDSLNGKQQAKILRLLRYVKEYGLLAISAHTKKLTGTPLWEIRILGNDNLRILYISVRDNSVLLLHGFIKKKQKTPFKEINIALLRLNKWRST